MSLNKRVKQCVRDNVDHHGPKWPVTYCSSPSLQFPIEGGTNLMVEESAGGPVTGSQSPGACRFAGE